MNRQLVLLQNDGVIDVRSIKTFGVSVKKGSNPIGYFGTGLKYAIAIFLRHNQKISIVAGGTRYDFDKKKTEIRDQEFEIVTMNGEEMPFTTELGKNWELWQAFRELYCNCIDEKGHTILFNKDEFELPSHDQIKDKTLVIIEGAEAILTYHEKDTIVLNMHSSLRVNEGEVEVFDRPSKYLYYRNVRVLKLGKPSMMTYNIIRETRLTEDRTFENPGLAIAKLVSGICSIPNKSVLRKILTTTEECLESSSIEFSSITSWDFQPSVEFDEVVGEAFERNTDRFNKSALMYWRQKKNKESTKSYEVYLPNEIQDKQISRCLNIMKKTFNDFDEYDMLLVKTLGESTMAIAEIDQRRMVISSKCFEYGTKFLLSTMIEEYVHIKTGHQDCTRQLQTYLFDSICSLIENFVIEEAI